MTESLFKGLEDKEFQLTSPPKGMTVLELVMDIKVMYFNSHPHLRGFTFSVVKYSVPLGSPLYIILPFDIVKFLLIGRLEVTVRGKIYILYSEVFWGVLFYAFIMLHRLPINCQGYLVSASQQSHYFSLI